MLGLGEAKPKLERLTQRTRDLGIPTLHLELEMAAMLQRNKFLDEALSLLLEVRRSKEAKANKYDFFYSGVILIPILGRTKDHEAQIQAGKQVIEFLTVDCLRNTGYLTYYSELFMTIRHNSLLLGLNMLEGLLRKHGRADEADRVQAQLNDAVDNPI